MSAYVPTDWVDGATPLNAANFDKIEAELVLLDARKVPDPSGLDEKWLKAESGAMVWVDAPTGGGGSSIEYENAWAAGTPYLAGDVVEHEGVQYLAVNPSTGDEPAPAAAASPVGVIPLVTSLPATPFDGQEVIFVDVIGTATYSWRLRYVAARATNRWIFVGGAAGYSEVAALEATTSLTYTALATAGPSFTVPVAGDYMVETGFNVGSQSTVTATIRMSYDIGATGAVDADAVNSNVATAQFTTNVMRARVKAGLAAATALVAKYKVNVGSIGFEHRWMRVTPVAVGG